MHYQIKMDTIYLDGNKSSHFNPIKDSLRIYFVLFKFILCSLFCFGLDIVLFFIFYTLWQDVFICTYSARILSGIANFSLNKYTVFQSKSGKQYLKELFAYVLLAIVIASLSAGLVKIIILFNTNIIITKMVVDTLLFLASFMVQKKVIFST